MFINNGGVQFPSLSQTAGLIQSKDLFVEEEFIKSAIGTYNMSLEKQVQPIIPQLTPIGIALVVGYLNCEHNLNTPITVSTSCNSLLSLVERLSTCAERTKIVTIFYPNDTPINGDTHGRFHKSVFYLEKRNGVVDVLFIDSVSWPVIERFIRKLFADYLDSKIYKLYTMQRLIDPNEPEALIHLQTNSYLCGPYAIQNALDFARKENVFEALFFTSDSRYILPLELARLAESPETRKLILDQFPEYGPELGKHYNLHPQKHHYARELAKYQTRLAIQILSDMKPEQILQMIHFSNSLAWYLHINPKNYELPANRTPSVPRRLNSPMML